MTNKSSRPLWKLLLATSNQSQTPAVTCDECFLILEYLAELRNAPELDRGTLRKLAQQHLSACPDCREYYWQRMRQMERIAAKTDVT